MNSAASSASNNVWVFTSRDRVLRWNGSRWIGVAKFTAPLSGGVVINPNNVWIFGAADGSLGTWQYTAAHWYQFGSLDLQGGSDLGSSSIWTYGGTNVESWNARNWATTSVANLLPANTLLCRSAITGIDALSPSNVWATATGGCQDFLGPFVLLHFNGTSWRRAAIDNQLGRANALVSDGHGGLWMPVATGSPAATTMLHYSNGKLGSASLPFGARHLGIFAASVGHNTTTAFAVGYSHASSNGSNPMSLILRFGS